MLYNTDKIVVALSGGADSMTLLHFLTRYCKDKNVEVIAGHINHCIRGSESDRDEMFVRKWCEDNSIKLYVKSFDVINIAKEKGIGLEECGRELRYEFLNQLCDDKTKIATAHTASDNTETLLFRLARGTGMRGACGIPPIRDNIIRPLLYITREEIEKYCEKFSISYVTDSTNASTDYNRNKIRHCVVPTLKEINPSLHKSVSRFITNITNDYKFIEQVTNDYKKDSAVTNGYLAKKLLEFPQSIRNRIIFSICLDYNVEIDNKKCSLINDILSKSGAVELNGNYRAVCKQGLFRIVCYTNVKNKTDCCFERSIFENKIVLIDNKCYNIDILDIAEYKKNCKINNLLLKNALDYDTINSDVVFRYRLSGDKFITSNGKGCSKTLKKYFNELKIPSEMRDNIVILASENNVIWIDGIGVSKNNAINDKTKSVAVITVKECNK